MAKHENKNTTKKRGAKAAIVASFAALLLCGATLVGTTFAWFTDTASTASNSIQAGNLNVALQRGTVGENGAVTWTEIPDGEAVLFGEELWEPGHVRYELLKVENAGNLALKWKVKVSIDPEKLATMSDDEKAAAIALASQLDVYFLDATKDIDVVAPASRDVIVNGENQSTTNSNIEIAWQSVGTLNSLLGQSATQGKFETEISPSWDVLPADEGDYSFIINGVEESKHAKDNSQFGIALGMKTSAGNAYQNLSIPGLKIEILATQAASESDSFSIEYDKEATFDE